MIEGHKKHKFGVTQLVFCTAWLCVHYANATFMGTYQSQGVKAFPEVKDVQNHCNNLILSETYFLRQTGKRIEYRPGYDSLSASTGIIDEEVRI